jgi:hydrogenase-4 component F
MILLLLIFLPFAVGALSYFISSNGVRRALWFLVALGHLALSSAVVLFGETLNLNNSWVGLDPLSLIFLPITSLLFLGSTIYGISSFRGHASHGERESSSPVTMLKTRPEAVFTGCMLLFLSSMTCVIVSRKLGLQWVSMEATTLAGTPLVYYHGDRRSLEAAWKFILLCSVGIAVALLGVFSLALASSGIVSDLTVDELVRNALKLDPRWLKLSFVFIIVGYGAKMGLAPLHSWLPDAHSEAPSPVSALLSGAMLNCAFLGILRIQQIMSAASMAAFGQHLMVIFGLLSMGVAGVFILRQPDYKRLLAYSSVEHMGIITLGVGLGGVGVFGSLLHAVNHSLVKAMLFMTAGNILAVYGTKVVSDVRGISKRMPLTGVLWLGGFLAITGSPPFGTFISEITILKSALDQGRFAVAGLYLAFLSLIFIAMAQVFIRMTLGAKDPKIEAKPLGVGMWAPPLLFGILALILGLFIPDGMSDLLHSAAGVIGGAP